LPDGKKDPIGANNMVAVFRFADGSVGTLTYCTVGSRTSGGERVEAFAQGVGITTEDFKQVTIKTSVRQSKRRVFAEKGYDSEIHAFVDALRKGAPPPLTVRDGARATLACLRMMESARTGMPRTIDLDALCPVEHG
jgi:predicted dehydrogenase